jgi:activator of HSP90 ATPase
VNLEEDKQIVMKWKMRDWETYSDVIINFDSNGEDDVLLFRFNEANIFFTLGSCIEP